MFERKRKAPAENNILPDGTEYEFDGQWYVVIDGKDMPLDKPSTPITEPAPAAAPHIEPVAEVAPVSVPAPAPAPVAEVQPQPEVAKATKESTEELIAQLKTLENERTSFQATLDHARVIMNGDKNLPLSALRDLDDLNKHIDELAARIENRKRKETALAIIAEQEREQERKAAEEAKRLSQLKNWYNADDTGFTPRVSYPAPEVVAPVQQAFPPILDPNDIPARPTAAPRITEPQELVAMDATPTMESPVMDLDDDEEDEIPYGRPSLSKPLIDSSMPEGAMLAKPGLRDKLRDTKNKFAGKGEDKEDNGEGMSRKKKIGIALGLTAVIVAGSAGYLAMPNGHHEQQANAAAQDTQSDTELAAAILGSCDTKNSFSNVTEQKTFTATGDVAWTTTSNHVFGPDAAHKTSIITTPKGVIDVTLCDSDTDPAATVADGKVTLDLAKATVLARVRDGGTSWSFAHMTLDKAQPRADGSITAQDIAELKADMNDTDALKTAQLQALDSVRAQIIKDPSLLKNDAVAAANKQAKQLVAAQLADIEKDGTHYTVAVKGKVADIAAVTMQSAPTSKKVAIDKIDVKIND